MIPRVSWFLRRPPSELHGLGHTARVMVWSAVLARDSEWLEPAVWAAACHDLRRESDGIDPEHGHRAGAWVRRELPALLGWPAEKLDVVACACHWHATRDAEAGWRHPVLRILKDADALDRVRLGHLDPHYLRLDATHAWIGAAERLYAETADDSSPDDIWRKAEALDLPIDPLRWVLDRVPREGSAQSAG